MENVELGCEVSCDLIGVFFFPPALVPQGSSPGQDGTHATVAACATAVAMLGL